MSKPKDEEKRPYYEALSELVYWEGPVARWRVSRCRNKVKKGSEVGSIQSSGYKTTQFSLNKKGKTIYLHRLRWFMEYGEFPKGAIDHIDRDKTNNVPSNFRDANVESNGHNRGKICNKFSSDYKNVCWDKYYTKWLVQVRIGSGIRKFGGRFDCEIEAAKRADQLAKEFHKEFAVLNFPD